MTEVRCAIYARVSTEKQGDSVDHQVSLLREMVASRGEGWRIDEGHVYEDEGVSATRYSIWTRPAMKRLLAAAEERQFSVVLFKGISRFARNTQEALQVLDRLRAKGLRVISYEESYDSAKEDSNFLFTMHAAIAEYEAEKIGVRVRLGNKEKARSGRFVGGTPPYGYVAGPDGRLAVDEPRAEAVRLAFRLYVEEGIGCFRIAQRLNDLGFATATGRPWGRSSVARILQNEVYTGTLVYNRRSDKSVRDYDSVIPGKKKEIRRKNPRSEWVVVPGAHPAVVSPADFGRAAKRLGSRGGSGGAGLERGEHWLSGLLTCARCGARMVAQTRRYRDRVYRYYACRTYHQSGRAVCSQPNLRAGEVEALVAGRLAERVRALASPERIADRIAASASSGEDARGEADRLRRALDKVMKDTAALYFQRESMTPGQYGHLLGRLKAEAERLSQALEKCLADLRSFREDPRERMRETVSRAFSQTPWDPPAARRIARALVRGVTAEGAILTVEYAFCHPCPSRVDGNV